MSDSYSRVYIHAVFSTKHREPFLSDRQIRAAVFEYLAGVSAKRDCPTIAVGGIADHVHILAMLGRTTTQADWIKELKRASTIWIRKNYADLSTFEWQIGYGAFSVSASGVDWVAEYVRNQEARHRRIDGESEFRALARKHGFEIAGEADGGV